MWPMVCFDICCDVGTDRSVCRLLYYSDVSRVGRYSHVRVIGTRTMQFGNFTYFHKVQTNICELRMWNLTLLLWSQILSWLLQTFCMHSLLFSPDNNLVQTLSCLYAEWVFLPSNLIGRHDCDFPWGHQLYFKHIVIISSKNNKKTLKS